MALSKTFSNGKQQNLQDQIRHLMEALEDYKMPSCASVSSSTDEVMSLSKQLRDLGAKFDDHDQIGYIINSLPAGYSKIVDSWMLICADCRNLHYLLTLIHAVAYAVDSSRRELELTSNSELAKNVSENRQPDKQQRSVSFGSKSGEYSGAGLSGSCRCSCSASAKTEPIQIKGSVSAEPIKSEPTTDASAYSDESGFVDRAGPSTPRQASSAQVPSSAHGRPTARKISGKCCSSDPTTKETISFIFRRTVPCCITYDKNLLYKYVKCESTRYVELEEKEFIRVQGKGIIYTDRGNFPAYYAPNETQNILSFRALDKKQPNLHRQSIAFNTKLMDMVRRGLVKDGSKLRFITCRQRTLASSHMEKPHSAASSSQKL